VEGKLFGRKTHVNGRTQLEGEFREGKIYNGKGVLQLVDGTVEEGQWVEGKLTGRCTRTYPDGRALQGEFREGNIFLGKGVQNHADNTVEEGQWVEGKLVGLCKRTHPDGRVDEGSFVDDKLVKRATLSSTATVLSG
jgi:hypothetical protein